MNIFNYNLHFVCLLIVFHCVFVVLTLNACGVL